MPQITVVERSGRERSVDAPSGQSVMSSLRDAGVDDILALCGGNCSCATCHVYVDPEFLGNLNGMSADENNLLEGSGFRKETSRLSCQLEMNDSLAGMRVVVAPEE
jgi:2Fe-2S ferredoxin